MRFAPEPSAEPFPRVVAHKDLARWRSAAETARQVDVVAQEDEGVFVVQLRREGIKLAMDI